MMSRQILGSALVFAVIVMGCSNSDSVTQPGELPPTGTFSVIQQAVWPGATVQIKSDDFKNYGDDAELEFGDISVPTSRVDDETLQAELPQLPAGTLHGMIKFAGYEFALPDIALAGYLGAEQVTTAGQFPYDVYVTRLGGVPFAIGGNLEHELAFVNLRNGSVSTVPNSLDYSKLRGPGMTSESGVWVLRSGDQLTSWDLSGTPTQLSVYSDFAPSTPRQVARFSANVWYLSYNNRWTIWTRPDGLSPFGEVLSGDASEPEGVHISPRGDRAAIRVDRVFGGAPVFDAQDGAVAYNVALTFVGGVDFTPDGEYLALVGGTGDGVSLEGSNNPVVQILRASDGQIMASKSLQDSPFAVAFDEAGKWLYVGVSVGHPLNNSRPAILVLDRSDLSTVAELLPPVDSPKCSSNGNCYAGVIAADGDHVRAYMSNGPSHLWDFKLITE